MNLNEKILMCENTSCEFPFGYEDLMFRKEDNDLASDHEVSSIKTKRSQSSQGTPSVGSAAEWSEIDKLNRACAESEDNYNQNVYARKRNVHEMKTRAQTKENEEKIKQNVEQIKQLNKVLYDNGDELELRNEKWIKNLFALQVSSGKRLVKEQELQKLKKIDPSVGMGELKIDIDSRKDSMSSIKIEISNNTDHGNNRNSNK